MKTPINIDLNKNNSNRYYNNKYRLQDHNLKDKIKNKKLQIIQTKHIFHII
ncbi:Uncharacterised protein [Providencia rettgeri]|nr:hypothetical protein [Providencia rettgeri]CAB5588923.1 Uncharacterised protein [Providencia rettgeri]CAC9109961.1 Uncharacterised protein [Providencia rettgeri]